MNIPPKWADLNFEWPLAKCMGDVIGLRRKIVQSQKNNQGKKQQPTHPQAG